MQPAAYLVVAVSFVTAGIGVLLLVETILNYGPLYRREAIAVALSTLPPAGGTMLWLLGVGPWPALNLAPVLFLPHVALDAYAFVGTHMFDTNPTTRRAAERSAFDRLASPLLVVDPGERVVDVNDRAVDLFDCGGGEASLPVTLDSLVGADLETLRERGEYESDVGDRVFAVSITPLTDPRDAVVGQLLVLYDITAERRQREQLTVLNRVLRHNLRNEMTVIQGRANLIEAPEGSPTGAHVETILGASARLLSISSKASDFDRLSERDLNHSVVDPEAVLDDLLADLRESHPAATVTTETDLPLPAVRTDRGYLSVVLSNLVENGIVHAPGNSPTVSVRARPVSDGRGVAFEVRDENPEIESTEIAAIRDGGETSLRHGSGIGLWIVAWCVRALDGDLEFTYDDGNVVRVTVPNVAESASPLEEADRPQARVQEPIDAATSNGD
ncbi:sensor histidine kinase [Halobellus rufus]|uniref:sensor histidine kinase n=1 Tax=Halobellus rufus TaxID=1448860 RepID=UPI002F35222B